MDVIQLPDILTVEDVRGVRDLLKVSNDELADTANIKREVFKHMISGNYTREMTKKEKIAALVAIGAVIERRKIKLTEAVNNPKRPSKTQT